MHFYFTESSIGWENTVSTQKYEGHLTTFGSNKLTTTGGKIRKPTVELNLHFIKNITTRSSRVHILKKRPKRESESLNYSRETQSRYKDDIKNFAHRKHHVQHSHNLHGINKNSRVLGLTVSNPENGIEFYHVPEEVQSSEWHKSDRYIQSHVSYEKLKTKENINLEKYTSEIVAQDRDVNEVYVWGGHGLKNEESVKHIFWPVDRDDDIIPSLNSSPRFDSKSPSIVPAQIGSHAYLPCTIVNLGDKSVSNLTYAMGLHVQI